MNKLSSQIVLATTLLLAIGLSYQQVGNTTLPITVPPEVIKAKSTWGSASVAAIISVGSIAIAVFVMVMLIRGKANPPPFALSGRPQTQDEEMSQQS
ncbi:alanine tRS [Acrasis kona]|uniref:Alanine tRS n=1 Tax=Acrasis kona TaxID=1008807 RepID=A0AAW2YKP1_9EUKA